MDLKPSLPEIDPVAGTEIQPQLRDAFSGRFNIAKESFFQAVDADADSGTCLNIETVQPFGERFPPGLILANEDFAWGNFQMRSWAKSHV
jgi:hypothetical protein